MNDLLYKIVEQKHKEKKQNTYILKKLLKQYSQISFELPLKVENTIIKLIKEIDFFCSANEKDLEALTNNKA